MKYWGAILVLFLLFSCKKENRYDCIKSTGKVVDETRTLESFHTLDLTDHIHVNLIPSTENKAIVNAGENLQSLVKTTIENGILSIENSNKCNFMRSYKAQITIDLYFTNLSSINMTLATGNVIAKDTIRSSSFTYFAESCTNETMLLLHTDSCAITVQGATMDISVYGTSKYWSEYSHTGVGKFDASKFKTPQALVYNKALGNIYLFASKYIWASILYKGNVYYSGNPSSIQKEEIGTGKLIEE